MSNHRKRLRAIEARLNAKHLRTGNVFRTVIVEGGLQGSINWAYAGAHRWKREDGEELEAFAKRAADLAIAAGETALVVGGLPRSDELAAFPDFESWWASIAEHYPEVPPEEPAGYARRAQW
ncbi:hypothetical protein [Bradyrhizobium uaiense]|uniref:Uncharacterized protein n=1 Tax=Bradyrhizobium uaiense TaxID=2594946 RepID=A0A6P1BB76_9BRAD|nr:hypothetical protein [Bradyrhizobium uaiense]NEU95665.1 hypothetical protein [Bradyrhizobium uaiense]